VVWWSLVAWFHIKVLGKETLNELLLSLVFRCCMHHTFSFTSIWTSEVWFVNLSVIPFFFLWFLLVFYFHRIWNSRRVARIISLWVLSLRHSLHQQSQVITKALYCLLKKWVWTWRHTVHCYRLLRSKQWFMTKRWEIFKPHSYKVMSILKDKNSKQILNLIG